MEKHITHEASAQQVFIIQLDHNVQFNSSQAIPLHILENDLDADVILPLLQQKQEPHKESNDTVLNNNSINPNVQVSSVAPMTVHNNVDIVQETYQNFTQYRSELKKQSVKVPPISVKEEPKDTHLNFEVEVTANRILPRMQKIKNYVHIPDTKAPPRAVAVLPAALHFRRKLILPRRTLSSRIRFGPVQGTRTIITRSEACKLASNATTPVFLVNHDAEHVIHIDVTDKDKSNWMGFLSLGDVATPATPTTANVWLYEENNELYALTVQPITARTPLKLGYSKKYCEDHVINDKPVLDLETVNNIQWWCNECNRALPSSTLLQRHTDVYHKDTVKSSWPSYRCKYCRKPFGRIFSLKRHMITHCTKKPVKTMWYENYEPRLRKSSVFDFGLLLESRSEESQINKSGIQGSTELNPEPDINTVLEDNRIPSDESFQNFSNCLDFSTNLFDTDRIALDISAHSRVDSDPSDINSYDIGFRDENGLSNDLEFAKLTNGSEPLQSENIQDKKMPILDTCTYCNQAVAKESKSKHLRQCPSRLICECGRVFRHKKSLAIHIHKSHPNTETAKLDRDKTQEDKKMAYKCQECSTGFKRRGMLVNHLWRNHKMISTTPVEVKVKHYPCVVCPKIYRNATKRNKHVRVHHPGAEKLRGQSIEGGVKSCQPASCTECPRQYATRAKLLQHIRAHHPHLAKAINKQEMEKRAKTKSKKKHEKREASEGTLLLEVNRSPNYKNIFL